MKSNRNTVAAPSGLVLRTTAEVATSTTAIDYTALVDTYLSMQANITDSSKATYRRALSRFFVWLQGKGINTPTRMDVTAYKLELMSEVSKGGRSALTVCSYINAVRSFFGWIAAESSGSMNNIAEGIRSPKHTTAHKKQHLETDKASELLSHYKDGYKGNTLRDYAIVNLLLRTGLRTAELVGADVSDISFIGSTRVLWIKGKGHTEKDSYVQLTEKAYAPLRDYLSTRLIKTTSEPLFVSDSNHHQKTDAGTSNRLTTRTIRNIVREGLDAIGLDDKAFTAHSLRHTTAVMILEAGGGIDDVQAQLRHASPNTSRIYVESFNRDKQLSRINTALDMIL